MIVIKKVISYILFLVPWFATSLLAMNSKFYSSLYLPNFAPKTIVFSIVWPILFILLAASIYLIYQEYKFSNKTYLYTLLFNYFFNQCFTVVFFLLKSPFLGLIFSLGTQISSLFLFNETFALNKKASYLLIPYILWNTFAVILAFSIFLLNL